MARCAVETAGYREVVIVAHSFGTIVATDILADRKPVAGGPAIALVTWGSPAAVMRHRSRWLRDEIARLRVATGLVRWDDVHSDSDWLCAAHPARVGSKLAGTAPRIDFDASLFERLTGHTHVAYYNQPDALSPLLA